MATQSTVLAAARRRYGTATRIRYHDTALSPQEKREARDRIKTITERIAAIADEQKSLGDTPKALCEAARFVVDVNGDETALPTLRKAVEAAEHYQDMIDEKAELFKERAQLRGRVIFDRWEIVTSRGIVNCIECGAYTLDDLLAEIERKALAASR